MWERYIVSIRAKLSNFGESNCFPFVLLFRLVSRIHLVVLTIFLTLSYAQLATNSFARTSPTLATKEVQKNTTKTAQRNKNSIQEITPDSQTENIIKSVIFLKEELLKRNPKAIPAVFLDYDGTIIKGDITEGAKGKYRGLAEILVEKKLVQPPYNNGTTEDLNKLLTEYETIYRKSGDKAAYAFICDVFSNLGSKEQEQIDVIVNKYFKEVLYKYHFYSSKRFIEEFSKHGISIYIISGSPKQFIQGSRNIFPMIPAENLFGINRERNSSGQLIDPIIHFAQGKVERIKKILDDARNKGKKIVPIGGFGNSWASDAPFLHYVANQGGLAVMINGFEEEKVKIKDHRNIKIVQQGQLI